MRTWGSELWLACYLFACDIKLQAYDVLLREIIAVCRLRDSWQAAEIFARLQR